MAFMLIPMCPMLMADIANQSQNFFLKPLMCFKINFNYISNVCLFVYFLAALGLHCCTWAFSSCSERGLLFPAVCGLLIAVASFVEEHGL